MQPLADKRFFVLQDILQPQSVPANKGTAPGQNNDSDDNEPMDEDDEGEKNTDTASGQQNTKSHDAEGALNTKVRKSAKKKGKKAKKSSTTEDLEGDYDFKVDYFKKGSAKDDASDEEVVPENSPSNDKDIAANTSSGSKLETPIELD